MRSFALLAASLQLLFAVVHAADTSAIADTSSTPSTAQAASLLNSTRNTPLLQNYPGQVPLPDPSQVGGLDVANIQGDILVGMKKNKLLYYFFSINNTASFKKKLRTITPLITNTLQLLDPKKQPVVALNVAFSKTGLDTLGVTDDLGDAPFNGGQFADAANLGDPGTGNWVQAFAGTSIHGVFLLASDKEVLVTAQRVVIESIFGKDIIKRHTLLGASRPGAEAGHEHFGFLDGISQPAITGFGTPFPGQIVVNPGVFLLNETGDPIARPAWSKDGSFLAFRQLKQLVPEFNKFLVDNAPPVSGLSQSQSVDLLGARMVGRWKSGAPVDLSPRFDNATLGGNPQLNNNFDYTHPEIPGFNFTSDQSRCPFDAHIRKTHPRGDLNAPANTIIRAGIPYGPEVTASETNSKTTTIERGLAFVSYQAQLSRGFQFLQHSWANNPGFIFNKNDTTPGFDPIIGANAGQPRFMSGMNVNDASVDIQILTDFVVSRGGEYFFSPSISAIKTVLTA